MKDSKLSGEKILNKSVILKSDDNEDFSLVNNEYEPIDFDAIRRRATVSIRKSTDGDFVFREVKINNNADSYVGTIQEISRIYNIASEKEELHYKISGKEYQFFDSFNQEWLDRTIGLGGEFEYWLAENGKIIDFSVTGPLPSIGVVLDLRKGGFDAHTLKLLFLDGTIREWKFSEKLMNTKYIENFFEYFKKGTLVKFYTDSRNDIIEIENAQNIERLHPGKYIGQEPYLKYVSINGAYDSESQTFGNKYKLEENSPVFVCDTLPEHVNEDNIRLVKKQDLINGKLYNGVAVCDNDPDAIGDFTKIRAIFLY